MTADPAVPAPNSPADTTPAGNKPNFADEGALALARENARLAGEIAKRDAAISELQTKLTQTEGKVDEKKQQELEQRLTALEEENKTLKGENDSLKGDKTRGEQLAKLQGKVRDPEAVLALLSDDLKDKDGNPDLEKIIGKYPYFAPEGVTTPTVTTGAGGTQAPALTTLDKAVESKDRAAINAAFDAELKGVTK